MIRRFAMRLAAALLTVALAAGSGRAMTILPLDLPELAAGAARIFVGRVESVASGRDQSGLPAVWTTFTVDEPLKGWPGGAPGRLTLKQLGASFGGAGTPVVPHAALPRYRAGEAVLLFLHAESVLGFTSPVGLGQGAFRITNRNGRRTVENDVGNRNLKAAGGAPRSLASAGHSASAPSAALPLDDVIARIQTLVGATP